MKAALTTRVLKGFEDVSPQAWSELLQKGDTDGVNLTWEWQRSWWNSFRRGTLLLISVEREGELLAIAPLFADGGMIFNLCPEDCLDFVGSVDEPAVLDGIIAAAAGSVPDFAGMRLYFVPDTSNTGARLQEAAARLKLHCYDEGFLPSPFIDILGNPDAALKCTRKKSLLRHENFLRRNGSLTVEHMRGSDEISPGLDEFFEQHVRRRAVTSHPSLFEDERQCDYYRRLTREVGPTGWLRFTRLMWNDKPIAFHYGLCYRGRYLFGIPSFDVELSRHSPGEVLVRQLLLAAIEEGASTFDFGMGDEAYKYRFATGVVQLRTWGLYPAPSAGEARIS